MRDHFKNESLREKYILQKEAHNHPVLSGFSTGGLISFRIMTLLGLREEAEAVALYMSMPVDDLIANNGVRGGIMAQMNLETRRFDFGIKRVPRWEVFTHHPEAGGKIEGWLFEHWPEMRALAKRAHLAFPEIFGIGWDLALTPDGPLIIEGNTQWGIGAEVFYGQTGYIERYLEVLEKEREAGGWLGTLI